MRLVTRNEIGLDPVVRNSNGTKRLALIGERWITGHWPGTKVNYATKDVARFIVLLEAVMAANNKPNEYNYVIGPQDDGLVHEYAGGYAGAHSEGENQDSVGCLFLIGMSEQITDAQIVKYQWLRDRVLRPYGIVRDQPDELPHGDMPGAQTQCPGVVRSAYPRLWVPYIDPVSPVEEDDMMIAIYTPPDGYPTTAPWLCVSGGGVRPACSADLAWAGDHSVPVIQVVDTVQYDNLVRSAGLG